MERDILIYGSIDSWSSQEFFESIAQSLLLNPEADLVFRVNCNGGEPEYGWGMIAKFLELKSKKLKVDGKAYSMGCFFLCYVEEVEAVDTAQFMVHRAAYPTWFESNPEYFTDQLKSNLVAINKSLETAFRNKIDVPTFEALKGVKIKDIFSMESRIDVFLNATEAKKVGLINNIVKITPAKKAEIESFFVSVTAKQTGNPAPVAKPIVENHPKPGKIMTLAEFKAAHPALYAEIVEAERKAGAAAEKERIETALVYHEIDPVAVKAIIASDKPVSASQAAEFNLKALANLKVTAVKKDATGKVITDEPNPNEQTPEQKKLAEFEADLEAKKKARLEAQKTA